MTIYDFVNLINDCENIVFKVFDCNSQDCVVVQADDRKMTAEMNVDELLWSEYADYEIGGTDVWIDKGKIYIEFNIDVEEDNYVYRLWNGQRGLEETN